MAIRLATDADKERWNQFVFLSPAGSFLQSWEWGEFQQALGLMVWRIVLEQAGTWQAAALVVKRPLPFGKSWLYAPRGPSFAPAGASAGKPAGEVWQELEQYLRELAQKNNAVFVRLDPAYARFQRATAGKSPWEKADREVQPRATIILSLTKSAQQLLSEMHQKTRYNIRLAEKHGVQVRFSTAADDLEQFLRLSEKVSLRSGFRYHPPEYYRTMLATLSSTGMLELAVAAVAGTVLAVNILIYGGDTVTYAHGASSNESREVMAPYLLHWESIKRSQGRGLKKYDLYGVAPHGSDKNHPWAGITRFKQGWGGQYEEYSGAYDYVLQEWWYTLYRGARQLRHHF